METVPESDTHKLVDSGTHNINNDIGLIKCQQSIFILFVVGLAIICIGIGIGIGFGISALQTKDCEYKSTSNTNINILNITGNNIDFEIVTPTWFDGQKSVGLRVNVDVFDDGFGMVYRATNRVPLPIHGIWNIFNDFLEFQSTKYFEYYGIHESIPVHVNGPLNDINQIISYKFNNETIYEQLNVRNESNYVIDIRMPLYNNIYNNSVYNKYGYIIRLYNDDYYDYNGCLIVIDIEWEFKSSISIQMKQNIMNLNKIKANNLLKLIYDTALDNIGLHVPINITVPVNIEWMWNFLSDWTNLKYILIAKQDSLNLTQSDIRIIESLSGDLINERISILDNINYIFEYQVLNNDYGMPFRDTIHLIKINDNTTLVNVKISMYPQPQQNADILSQIYTSVVMDAQTQWPSLLYGYYQNDTINP